MIGRAIRRTAIRLAHAAASLLPSELRPWGLAMVHEAEAIDADGAAIRFALGCIGFALGRAIAFHLLHPLHWPFTALIRAIFFRGTTTMDRPTSLLRDPRATTIFCAVLATGLGLAYLATAGAPVRHLAINAVSLLLGLLIVAVVALARPRSAVAGPLALAASATLLLTGLFGLSLNGAARWVPLGGLIVQPSLLLLPIVAIGFARRRDALTTAAIALAAAALAIQPDRAMAGALATAMLALVLVRPDRNGLIALGGALAGFMATLLRPETLPAAPYVDRILFSAFDVGPLVGIAVLAGSALLLLPAATGWRHDAQHRATHAAFGAFWLTLILAAALGNFPTPVVGYGGSAIVGYVLALLVLPRGYGSGEDPERIGRDRTQGHREPHVPCSDRLTDTPAKSNNPMVDGSLAAFMGALCY